MRPFCVELAAAAWSWLAARRIAPLLAASPEEITCWARAGGTGFEARASLKLTTKTLQALRSAASEFFGFAPAVGGELEHPPSTSAPSSSAPMARMSGFDLLSKCEARRAARAEGLYRRRTTTVRRERSLCWNSWTTPFSETAARQLDNETGSTERCLVWQDA